MNRVKKRSLPKGFRFLLTVKEVKAIEAILDIKFNSISFGHITNANFYQVNDDQNSFIHPVSVAASRKELVWNFSLYQSGFRNELLPEEFEKIAKERIIAKIRAYVRKVESFGETNFHNNPQLWLYIAIARNTAEVTTKEIT